jgi:hypothetical protein
MNYEAEVKKVYPDAKSHDDFRQGDCFISTDNPVSILGDGNTEKEAWQSAYEQITHQTKLADLRR